MGDTPKRKRSDLFSLESLERTNDPVKLYLRDMGHISLLTRKGEIAIAKQIERSYKNIIKALLKSRLLQNHIFYWEEKIRENPEFLSKVFDINKEGGAAKNSEENQKFIFKKIKKIRDLNSRLERIPKSKKKIAEYKQKIKEIKMQVRKYRRETGLSFLE